MATVLDHRDSGMRVYTIRVTHDPCDDPSLASSVSLNYPHRLSNLEALSHLECLGSHLHRFVLFGHKVNIPILDMLDDSFAVLELSLKHLDPITDLDLELWVISYGFHESIVVEKIPLILVLVHKLVEVRLGCRVHLEHFDLLETWANIFGEELVCTELLVEEPVPEHHLTPEIELLEEWLVHFSLALIFHAERIEQKLGHPDVLGLFGIGLHGMESFGRVSVEIFWDPWDESDHGLFVAIDRLD